MTAPATARAVVTADELDRIPGDGLRRELVDGEVRTMSPAGFRHGVVALRIGSRLEEFVRDHGLGLVVAAETGFRLSRDPDTVRAPDAAFVATTRLPDQDAQARFLDLAPDLAVEVVSPSDRAADVVDKTLAWLAAGTRTVWVVYPVQRIVVVYSHDGTVVQVGRGGEVDGGDVLPGLRLPVADLLD